MLQGPGVLDPAFRCLNTFPVLLDPRQGRCLAGAAYPHHELRAFLPHQEGQENLAAGKDPQLDRAIEIVLEALAKSPPSKSSQRPPFPFRVLPGSDVPRNDGTAWLLRANRTVERSRWGNPPGLSLHERIVGRAILPLPIRDQIASRRNPPGCSNPVPSSGPVGTRIRKRVLPEVKGGPILA